MGEASKREEREAAEEIANHDALVKEARGLVRRTCESFGEHAGMGLGRIDTVATVAAILALRDAVLDLPDVYLERVEELAREAAATAPRAPLQLTTPKPR